MPIREFECPVHGVFERIFLTSNSDFITTSICRNLNCDEICDRIWSLPVVKFDAPPTVVFRNTKTGELQVATHNNQPPPPNCIREELRGPIERSRFEKEATQRKNVENELITEQLKQGREQTAKNIHDDIKARMNSTTNKVYNPETKQEENISWDAETKGLLKRSMEHTRKKHSKIKPKKTNNYLAVNHIDSSNMVK